MPVNNQNNQLSYLGFNERDKTLFLPAERNRQQKPITETGILQKKNETEVVLILDIDDEMEDDKDRNDIQDQDEYTFMTIHKAEKQYLNADSLSRI
ncbi:10888_t:CDS:2 [Scutellospora calospora]|uniref:10888_t:CDS:1 n=1 Tax=Scutellospora calospora TaxID=85575 RepID=A0ACA9K164_9GLOM|nr:10888_t:CDS:2 [Scutellospora calospora]